MAESSAQPLTAAQAVAAVPPSIDDMETVAVVQQTLLDKGYLDGGPPDGDLGPQTKDEIIAFRARNNLPLVPVIDQALLEKLETAPQKSIPYEQITATPAVVAENVAAAKTNNEVKNVSAWSKLTAWFFGLPSFVLPLTLAIIDNFDEASTAIAPLRTVFGDLPGKFYFIAFGLIALVFGYQAVRIERLSKQVEDHLVTGYKIGTVKNDAPTEVINGKLP